MADPFGLSFSPGADSKTGAAAGQKPTPIQQAIQTLSLHIPRVAGAGAFTAQPLLNAPGGGFLGSAPTPGLTLPHNPGSPDEAAMLEQLRRLLFGPQQGPMAAPSGFGGPFTSMPMPRAPELPDPNAGSIIDRPPVPRIVPGTGPDVAPRADELIPPQPAPTAPMGRDTSPISDTRDERQRY